MSDSSKQRTVLREQFQRPQVRTIAVYLLFLTWLLILLREALVWESPTDRLFPVLFCTTAILLIVIKLLHYHPSINTIIADTFKKIPGYKSLDGSLIERTSQKTESTQPALTSQSELKATLWIIAFPVVTFFLGFHLAICVYLPLYLHYYLRDLRTSISYSIASITLILSFESLLGIRTWPGVLF